jgi:hypothetical protein
MWFDLEHEVRPGKNWTYEYVAYPSRLEQRGWPRLTFCEPLLLDMHLSDA